MTRIIALIRRDFANPFGSAVTTALTVALAALTVILLLSLWRAYLPQSDGIRAVGAEDDCAFGTKDVRRVGGRLYCIGEP